MGKSRKVVLDSVRLNKRLRDLARGNYVLRQEFIVCDTNKHLSLDDLEVLELDLEYQIGSIEMYFYNKDSAKKLLIEAGDDGIGRLVLDETDYSNTLLTCTEEYALFFGDDIPEYIEDGKLLERFELCLEKPILQNKLFKYGLTSNNNTVWDLFNKYEFRVFCDSFDVGCILGLDRKYSSDVHAILVSNGFISNDSVVYKNKEYNCSVVVKIINNKLNISYYDVFSNFVNNDYKLEVSEELGISDFAKHTLNCSSFSALRLNDSIDDAMYKLKDVNLDILLRGLRESNYVLDSIGLACVRSMVYSRTVCGFKNKNGYVYMLFYYGSREEEFLVRILSSDSELSSLEIDGVLVNLVNVCNTNDIDVSTLIVGFDFNNFLEYDLCK